MIPKVFGLGGQTPLTTTITSKKSACMKFSIVGVAAMLMQIIPVSIQLTGSVLEDTWKRNKKSDMDTLVKRIENTVLDANCSRCVNLNSGFSPQGTAGRGYERIRFVQWIWSTRLPILSSPIIWMQRISFVYNESSIYALYRITLNAEYHRHTLQFPTLGTH